MNRFRALLLRLTSHQHGYALVVIALLFAAFAAAAAAYLDRNVVMQKIDRTVSTRAQMARLNSALGQYYIYHNYRYPCPALYNLPETDVNFGAAISGCQTGALPAGTDLLSGSTEVIRGMVPVRELADYGIDINDAFDAWNGRIMYVVNRQMTPSGSGTVTAYPTVSEITIGNTSGTTAPNVPDVLLVSYGPDRHGAILRNKTSISLACGGTANPVDQNCNGDLTFDSGPAFTASTATASNYFDDIVSVLTHSSVPAPPPPPSSCANGATDYPACTLCPDGQGLSRNESAACPSGYTDGPGTPSNPEGSALQPQTRADCSSTFANSGAVTLGGCVTTSCANGATNYPTCTFPWFCTSTHCSNAATPTQTWTNCSGVCTTSGAPAVALCSPSNSSVVNTSCSTANAQCYWDNGSGGYCGEVYVTCTCTASGGSSSGTCDTPQTYQSNYDETGTVGDPYGPGGGEIISCTNGTVNGACAYTAGACDAGTASGYAANYTGSSCGGTATWNCVGTGGGTTASCSQDNTACTSCGTITLTGYVSGNMWRGPTYTPTYGGVGTDVPGGTGTVFRMTTDSAGSSWHPEVHTWTFVKGTASDQLYIPYDRKRKSTAVTIKYDGGNNVYAYAQYTRGESTSHLQYVQVALTGINSCVTSGGGTGGSCFTGDVPVTLADGSTKPISQLKPGDAVRGKTRDNHVLELPTHRTAETIYGFNGSAAIVTGGHPFWTQGGWKAIDPSLTPKEKHMVKVTKLKVGDVLFLDDGTKLPIRSIDPDHSQVLRDVYNPIMDGDHTYYAHHMLVHNKGCFTGDALVTMADGTTKPIAELKVGDLVKGKTMINEVKAPDTHESDEALYGFNGGKAFVTAEHMLMTTNGWRSIDPALSLLESRGEKRHLKKLKVGDRLVMQDGKTLRIRSIDKHYNRDGKAITLYNPGLDGDHTYYVNGMLVHNLKPIT